MNTRNEPEESGPILLIEDNEQNRYLVTYLLEHAGFRVVSAVTGQEGLELAKKLSPSVILLDIQLPGMDGYQVARSLRELPEINGIPIVAVTSYAMAGDREKALDSGCSGYIEKPIDAETFVSQIFEFIRPREGRS